MAPALAKVGTPTRRDRWPDCLPLSEQGVESYITLVGWARSATEGTRWDWQAESRAAILVLHWGSG